MKERMLVLQSETLMELLAGQCVDLQSLLDLARRETVAAQQEDFGELFAIAGERAVLGERLETYHRQIAELRDTLGYSATLDQGLATEIVQLATSIQAQDSQTTSLLLAARANVGQTLAQLDQRQRNSSAYLQSGSASGLNWDRHA